MFKKRRAAAWLILAFFLCAGTVFPGARPEEKFLRYGLAGNPDTLDPHKTSGTLTFQVIKSLYDTLVEPDEKGRIVPALAESWTTSADGKLWTFRLRQGVRFHNGSPLTAEDVRATFLRIKDPATASPKAMDFAAVLDIRTRGEATVEFVLSEPAAPLLATLASGWSAILPAALIEKGHAFASQPVGTGPFIFSEWIRDNKIIMKKNPSYWMAGLPLLPGIDFRIITERAVRVQGLLSGQLEVCEFYDNVDVPVLEKNPGTRVEKNLASLVCVIAINTSRVPDLGLRQAISHAIDKQSVLDIAYGGGEPVGTFMDFGDPYYKDFTGLYPYDPEKAKTLAAGREFKSPLEIAVPQNYEPHVRAAQLYQEMLAKAGIPARIRLVDWSTWLEDVYQKANYELTVIGHTGNLDPDARLVGYGTEKTYVRWVHPEAARLIAQARSVSDFAARKRIYDKVLEIMAKELPFVYTGTPYLSIGMRKNVEGFRMLPKIDTPDFRRTVLK